jgi:hypothetical protein
VADVIKNFELTLANTEAQRKKDLDMAGTQIAALKKDSETQIAALKKDLGALKKGSETQIAALKKDLGKAEDKIELLNREAATTKNEIDVLKENAAATERYIEVLAEDVEATTDFLALGVRLFSSLPLSLLLLPHYQGRGQSRSNQTQKPARPCSSIASHVPWPKYFNQHLRFQKLPGSSRSFICSTSTPAASP